MRQSQSTKQSKLMRFISSPIRSLTKAKNFYMRSLEDCAAKVGHSGCGYTASQVLHLPRSFSANSTTTLNGDEDLRRLIRTVSTSKKSTNDEKKVSACLEYQRGRVNGGNNREGMVKNVMGRIDEEMASTFEEDEVALIPVFYTRSRSYTVNKRPAGFV